MTQQPQTPQDLLGKTAVVTGSTDGIGLATAEALLARGANVMFNGLFFDSMTADGKTIPDPKRAAFEEKLKALQAQYPKQNMAFKEANVTQPHEVNALMDKAAELGDGKIDILVNNAGIQIPKAIGEITPQEYKKLIDINLNGAFNCMHYALPYLEQGQNPSIINIGSVHAHVASPGRAAYCSAKFGLDALTRVAAVDLAPKGIRVNMVSPAFVKTDLAMMQIKDRMEKLGETQEQAEAWRLQLQDGKWIEMETLTRTIGDIASGTKGHETGKAVLLDNGYVKRANLTGGVAYFNKAIQQAVNVVNKAIRAAAQGMGIGGAGLAA